MVVKAVVTPEEKARIQALAKAEGKSVTSYLRHKALAWTDESPVPLLRYIETQAAIAQRMNEIATNIITNKTIYEAEILELLDRMTALELLTADLLKEVSKNGNAG